MSYEMHNLAIDSLIQSSSSNGGDWRKLEWMREEITDVEPTQIDNIYYASYKQTFKYLFRTSPIMLLCLGSNEDCTQTLVSDFARKYSLPTHKYNKDDNRFRRYFR